MNALAIVGSVRFASPRGLAIARAIIDAELQADRPDLVVSGGADGVDTLAEIAALDFGIEPRIHPPKVLRWNGPGGFKERNQRIADDCTRALRISCTESRTYGSGWTVGEAQRQGKPVRRVRIDADGTVHDSGWPT